MLLVNHLLKKYGTLTVVNDVSFSVAKGEILSIVGPSGAGKSTLLHLLGALDIPDAGSVLIDGVDILKLKPTKQAAFRNTKLGFVFQFHHLLPEFTALENVCLPLWIKGIAKKEAAALATEMLGHTGLGNRLQNKPAELSGGEQQRVAIARALVTQPAIVLADEPTGNLDTANANAIHQLFVDLRASLGQTFLMITHNPELALMTDRTLTMTDGRIVREEWNSAAAKALTT
jgi:lipoprotein-releasing system ATP-binding protein